MDDISVPTWLTPGLIVSISILVVAIASAIIAYRKLKPGLRCALLDVCIRLDTPGQGDEAVI